MRILYMITFFVKVANRRQKGDFPKNEHFLPPDKCMHGCVSRGKRSLFFGKFGVLCFLVTPVFTLDLLLYTDEM